METGTHIPAVAGIVTKSTKVSQIFGQLEKKKKEFQKYIHYNIFTTFDPIFTLTMSNMHDILGW